MNCYSLRNVYLQNAVNIGNQSFLSATNLFSVSFNCITNIGTQAFAYCENLTNLTFKCNAPTIGSDIFVDAGLSTQLYIYATNPTATGWGTTFGGMPVVRMTAYTDQLFTPAVNFTNGTTLTWNASEEVQSLEYTHPDGGSVTINGEIYRMWKNVDSVAITNGQPVCLFAGAGRVGTIKLADADDPTRNGMIGVYTGDAVLPINGIGRITTFGAVKDAPINSFLDTAITEGAQLYVSTNVGHYTATAPSAPVETIKACIVTYVNPTPNKYDIEVAIDNPKTWTALDARYASGSTQTNIFAKSADPTGWETEDFADWYWDNSTRVLTISNNGTLWMNGVAYNKDVVSATIPTNRGLWFVYYQNGSTNLTVSQTPWSLNDAQLATVTIATNGNHIVCDEHHTAWMPWRVHRRFHNVPGNAASYSSGFDLTMSSSTSFSVASGRMYDEDLEHNLPVTNKCWIAYRDGTSGYGIVLAERTFMFATNSLGAACYDNAGVLTPISGGGVNNYVSMWLYAIDIENGTHLIAVVGQSQNTLANIRAESPPSNIANVIPGAEAILLYQVIIRGSAAVWTENRDLRLSRVTSNAASSETDPVWNAQKVGYTTFSDTTNVVTAVNSIPYTPFTATITPANGTATVVYAHGNMPVLSLDSATTITLDPTGYDTNGVSRIALTLYAGTNSVTLATNVITYATTPTLSTNSWNTILIRRVSNDSWKGVQL